LASEQSRAILPKQFRSKPSRLELSQVLLAEALVRGQQNNSVQLATATVFFEIKQVLQDVGVHQQRLAAAGGAPIGDFVNL
jgi:hypothetical protein